MKKRFLLGTIILAAVLFLSSCYTPSPLYGTWTDNDGDKIQFLADGTFSAKILDSSKNAVSYEGTWLTIDNVLVFNITGDNAYSRDTEWDIRGAILYLTWTANNSTKTLALYHTAR